MFKLRSIALASLLAFSGQAALADETIEERAYEFRHGIFEAIAWKFGALIQTSAKGDKAGFTKAAKDMAYLSTMTVEGFIPNSQVEGSLAKPSVWEDRATYEKKAKAFTEAVNELASADYDISTFNYKTFGSEQCGGCHRDFKHKEKH